jgi:hypothetical protein
MQHVSGTASTVPPHSPAPGTVPPPVPGPVPTAGPASGLIPGSSGLVPGPSGAVPGPAPVPGSGPAPAHLPAHTLGPRFAADVVAIAKEGAGLRLDYSPRSLALVDRIIDGIRREHPPAAAVAPALTRFGAYAGEVLHRAAGAVWVDFDPAQLAYFGQPFGVRTTDGRVWNPLGKAVKRYENGAVDSLRMFYLAVVGQARV